MTDRVAGLVLAGMLVLTPGAVPMAHGDEATGPEPATLVLWNRPIVTFRDSVNGVPPRQRVDNATDRIAALPPDDGTAAVTVQPVRLGTSDGLVIMVGSQVAFGLVPRDLDPESELTLEQAVSAAAQRLRALRAAQASQRESRTLLRGVGSSLLAILLFAIAVRLILGIRDVASGRLTALLSNRQVSIRGKDIIPTLESVERATFQVLSWALILGLAYVGVTYILYQFPYTEPLGEQLGDNLLGQLLGAGRTVASSLPSLLGVAAVLLITRAIALWASRLLAEIEHGVRKVAWLAQEQAKATRRIASGIIWLLGIATAYPLLPWAGSRAFQGMSVVLGLAVSFASSGLINHWVSGLVVLYARSYRVGDFVAVGQTEGVVTEMGALATKLRTMRREEITIPNGLMASDKLVNYTRLAAENGMLLSTSIAIGYDAPWQKVRELLLAAAAATPGVAGDPTPRVLTWELSDFSVNYQLHAFLARDADRIAVRTELNTRILDAFAAAGVQIMTPHYESQPERRVLPLEAISVASRGS